MKLGEIARVTRGVVTGNHSLFIMSRQRARDLGIEAFAKPILGGARDIPTGDPPIARDEERRLVIIIASRHEVEQYPSLRAHLGDTVPRIASVHPAPIAATYTGVPRFALNPDGLVITNALYTVTPRQNLNSKELLALVKRLNHATASRPKARFAERFMPRQFEEMEID